MYLGGGLMGLGVWGVDVVVVGVVLGAPVGDF